MALALMQFAYKYMNKTQKTLAIGTIALLIIMAGVFLGAEREEANGQEIIRSQVDIDRIVELEIKERKYNNLKEAVMKRDNIILNQQYNTDGMTISVNGLLCTCKLER